MRPVSVAVVTVVLAVIVGQWNAVFAQKNRCKDVAVRWFIYPAATLQDGVTGITSAIQGDGNWYSTSSGTSNTQIYVCGTKDATLLMGQSRTLNLTFPAPAAGSVIDESISSGSYQSRAFINVRNILCAGCADPHAPFTTRVSIVLYDLLKPRDYRLRFLPHDTDAINIEPPGEVENTPYEASPAVVIPQSYDCHLGGSNKPSWIVRGTTPNTAANGALQLGTLTRVTNSATPVHAGQYSMPFEMRIEALTCFTY
jgi:hypothetical protein